MEIARQFDMKGIILAGGSGTRMRPATNVMNKHLIPILNKPMILYPIETLKSFGVLDVMLVSGGEHIGGFAEFLGDGSLYGIDITYKVQKSAGGIAQALGLAKEFARGDSVLVILGDNVFENEQFAEIPQFISDSATLFLKEVDDPQRFGVVEYEDEKVSKIVEKPEQPKSRLAVTGLYFYPNDVFEVVKTLTPSQRKELEITDVNNHYIRQSRCNTRELKGFWSDAGTPQSMAKTIQWIIKKY